MPASSTASPRRSQQERVADSSRRLLNAAAELIAEQGFERTTTNQICARAGLSNSMVHMRYGSKEALIESLLASYEDALMVARDPDAERSGLEMLMDQVEAVRAQHKTNRQFMRAFFMLVFETVGATPQLKPWLTSWLDRYVEHITAIVRQGQQDGSIRRDVDPVAEANFFMDAGTGPLYRWALEPERVDLDGELAAWGDRMREWLSPGHSA